MNIPALRKLFPVTESRVFLNNGAESPLNSRVRTRLESYLKIASEDPPAKPSVRVPVRILLADLFGGNQEDYALVTSTGAGICIAASGINWEKGDNVVVPCDEHWNNTFPWLALREKGVEVRFVPVGEDQRVSPESFRKLTDSKTRIVATAAVRFNSGFRADLKQLSKTAHDNGALFLVDGIQGAGVYPFNVEEEGIDILACAGFKWLLGMPGTGFLYASPEAQKTISPVLPGMFAAELNTRKLLYYSDARRYETGTIAYSLFHSWTAGLELLKEIGIDNIHNRILKLTGRIIDGLRQRDIELVTPVATESERSAILSFTLGNKEENKVLLEKLNAEGIIVSLRDGRIRVSPNFFNTEEEIDHFLSFL